MDISSEIIEVLDHLSEKFGVVINWSSENVMPYVQELCGKYINWEISTSIAWIIIMFIIVFIPFCILLKCAIKSFNNNRDDSAVIIGVLCLLLFTVFVVTVGINTFDIIKCITFPELKVYEYIKLMAK